MLKHFLSALLLFFSQQINAIETKTKVSILQDAIGATEKNYVESKYFKELMDGISIKLQILAQEKGLSSPREIFTWLLTTHIIAFAAYSAAWDTRLTLAEFYWFIDPTLVLVVNKGWRAAVGAIYKARDSAQEARVQQYKATTTKVRRTVDRIVVGLGFYGSTRIALQSKACNIQEEGARFGDPVSEWAVLNYFLENIELIFNSIFTAGLENLPDHPANSPWESPEALSPFYNQLSLQPKSNRTVFLAHLICALPVKVMLDTHRPIFIRYNVIFSWPLLKQILAGSKDKESHLSFFPEELIREIIFLAMQVRNFPGGK